MTANHRIRVLIKNFLRQLSSFAAFRVPALALVRAVNRKSFDSLRRTRAIRDVYVRAGYVRGPFYPIASDVDLVLLLDNSLGRTLNGIESAIRSLRSVRRWNLSIRDWWQHMIL